MATFTLRDLIDSAALGLRLVAGGEEALERTVAGAHSTEVDHPSRFLPPDWVMLTLGINLGDEEADHRALVAELDEAGMCALGFGIGEAFEHVPRALLDEADSRRFPIFQIPYDTPFREIVGFVNRSLFSADFRTLQRSLSMQSYLMDALREPDPAMALVRRLGELLDATVLILDAHGHVQAASRDAPVDAIWARVGNEAPRLPTDGSDLLAVPIDTAGQPRRWLVVTAQRQVIPRKLSSAVIQSAERLLELIVLSRRASAADDRVVREELLASALDPSLDYAASELAARLERYGIDFARPTRILAIEPMSTDAGTLGNALEALFAVHDTAHLLAQREGQLVALVAAHEEQLDAWAGQLAEQGLSFVAGSGRCLERVADATTSLRDAQVALRQLRLRGATGLLRFEQFGVASWLVGITPPADVRAKADSLLGPLEEHPVLADTLDAYLREHLNVAATARVLNLHPNSLRYRLKRVEEVLGRSLGELPTAVDLYVASLARSTTARREMQPSGRFT